MTERVNHTIETYQHWVIGAVVDKLCFISFIQIHVHDSFQIRQLKTVIFGNRATKN